MATAKEPRVSTHGRASVGSETARRHRERESVVLAQIVAHATRLRHHLAALDANVGSYANANDSPLTLIELIQASTAVFAKRKIQAPSDAVFHRHLLTLSLDPEPDWKKKIQRFAAQQSLHRGSPPHASSVGSIAKASKRRTSMVALEVGFQTPSRRRSGVGGGVAALEERPPGWTPPATTRRQSKRSCVDQFGDVLAASSRPSMKSLKENQLRNTSRAEVATATDADERVIPTLVTPAQKLHDLATIRTRLKEIHAELSSEGEEEEEEEDHASLDTRSYGTPVAVHETDEDQTYIERSINVRGRSIPPHAYCPSPSKSLSLLSEASSLYGALDGPVEHHRKPQFLPHDFRQLATSFQQWRELTTFRRLVRDSRQRELRLTQAVLPPVATFAIFRWVAMALPSRTRPLPSQLSLVVPAFVVARGLAITSPSLLRHFTGRLLVWTMQRIFTTWAVSARAIKTVRIKSLIRRRTDDLKTAFQCLHQWRRVVRHRRTASDHGVWVETLHARKCLRWSLSIWRRELKTRRREGGVADLYKRRTIRLFLRSWQRWVRQCCAARTYGSRRRLARSLRVWKASIRWSEEEHRQLVRACTHWTRRLLRSCWIVWRVQRSVFKAKRLRTRKATRHYNGKTAQHVWRAWTESYGTRKVLESKCARFIRRRQTRTLRAILTGLYEYVHEKKWHALCVMDACARRHERLTSRVWRAWASHLDASRRDDVQRTTQWNSDRRRRAWHLWRRRTRWIRLMGTLTACVSSIRIQYGLFKWKTWAASRRQYRCLVNDWRREQAHLLARRVFTAFQETVKIGRGTLQAAEVLLHRCTSSRLQSYLNAWRQLAQRQRVRRLRDNDLTMATRRLHRRGRWAAWRQVFHVAHSIQIADDAMAQGIQRRCIQQWQKRVQACRKLLKSAGQLRQHRLKRAIWKLHRRAEANRAHRKNCSALRDRRDRFLMLRGWTAWRRGLLTATHCHARVAQAVLQWHHKSMAVHFYEWRNVLIRRRERHSRISAWRQRAAVKTTQSCWRIWQAYLVERHDRRSIVAHAEQHSERRSTKRVLQIWRCKCRHSQAQARVRQTCIARWRRHEKRRCFRRWGRFTCLQRSLRMMDTRHRDSLVLRCFAAWCKWKHRRDMAALMDDERTRQLQEWSMRRVVKRLRRHAAEYKCMRSSQQLVQLARSRAVQTAMLRRWMRYTTSRMHWHAQIKATEQKIQRYRVQRCMRQWGHVAHAKKVLASTLVQATTRTGRGLTSRGFTQWRSFVSDRKLRTTLQERALVFHVCCTTSRYFLAWKTYVDEQARKRRLLQISSQRRCQRCEMRAFQAWRHFASRARKARQAIGVRQTHSLIRSFASWRRIVSICKAKRDAIAHYESTTGRRIIHAWRKAARQQRLHRQFTQVLQAQTTQQCLRHWATHVRKTRRARSFLRRRLSRSLVRVFSQWKVLVETWRLTRSGTQQRLGLLLNQHRTMTGFLRWKALVDQLKLLKAKAVERTRQRICVLFIRWKTTLRMRKRIAERVVGVRHRHEHALVLAFWSRWKREKVTREKADVLRQRVLKRASQVLISVLFHAWKAFVCRALVVRAAENKRSLGSLRLRFSRWRDRFVNQRKRERLVVETIRRRHDLALVRCVLVRMRTHMSIKNACTRVLLPQLQRHVLAQAWQKWRQYHAHKRRTSCSVVALRHRLEGQRHSVYDTALVSLRRWQSLQQAHRFCHWRTVALHLQSMRAHTTTAIHMWWARLNRSCFQSWVAWIRQVKRKQTLRASSGRHRQARAWTRWVQYHRNRQRQHLLVEQARRFYRIHATRTATAAWRCVLSRRRHERLRESAVTLHRVQRSLRKWHGMAVHRRSYRMQCTVATVAAHHKRMSVAWSRWALWVAHVTSQRVELQQQTERLQVLVLCSAFRAWSACSQRQRYLTQILSMLRCRWKTATARRVLCAWAGYCRAVTAQRCAVSQLAWTSLMRNAVQRIRLYARQQIATRGRLHKAQAWSDVVQGRLVGRTFTRWRRFAMVSKQKRHVIQRYHLKKLLPGVFHAWKSFVQHTHSIRDRLERAAGCMRSVSTRRAWQAWSAFHRQRRATRRALTTAHGHFQVRLVRLVLVKWRSTIVHQRLARETSHNVLVRRKLQSTHRCFANWHSFVLGRKASRVAAAMVASRLTASQLHEAWSVWRRQFVVARVCARKQLVRVFDRWHRWRWERRAWAEFQATQTQTLLQTVRARCGIRHWKDRVMEAQMRKTMATVSSRFAKDTLVRRCFRNWLAFLVTRHHDKVQMKRVNEWLRNRQLWSCFRALGRYALAQQRDKRNDAMATAHAKKQAKRQAFSAWRRLAAVANTQRFKLRRHIAATHHATKRKCFLAWRALMSKRIHSRVVYANLVSRRTLLVTRVVLNQWKRSTHKSKRRQTAETFHRLRLCLHSLHQWHRFLVLTRAERMLRAREKRLCEWCLVAWSTRALLCKRVRQLSLQRQERNRIEHMKIHWTAWRFWSRVQIQCVRLLTHVATQHCVRLRFVLWKAFTENNRRLKRLVFGLNAQPRMVEEGTCDSLMLDTPAARLARISCRLQRFKVDWENPSAVWQRWRHAFHACLFYRMRRLYQVFSSWSTWSRRRRVVQVFCSSRLHARRLVLKKTLLLRWRDVVATVKQIQRERRRERELLVIVNAEMVRHERRSLQRHWNAWRERTETKRHLLLSADSYQRARVLTKFWLLWSHDFVSVRRREHQYVASRSAQLWTMKERRAIHRFRIHRAWRVRSRSIVSALAHERRGRWFCLCMDRWRRFADTNRRASLLAVFKKRQTVRRVYHGWHIWLASRRLQREEMEKFVARRMAHIRGETFLRWRAYVIHRRQRDDVMALGTAFHLQQRLRHRWHRAVQIQKQTRDRIEQGRAALATWRQRRVVRRWETTVCTQRLERRLRMFVQRKHFAQWRQYAQQLLADRFYSHLVHRRMRYSFHRWVDSAQERMHLRQCESQLRAVRAGRRRRAMWTAWGAFVRHQRNQQVAREHFSHTLKLKLLLHWYDTTKQTALDRAQLVAQADAFCGFTKKRFVLKRWVLALARGRQRRAVLFACVVKIQRAVCTRLRQVVLHAWADAADLERFTRECGGILQQRRAARSLRHWRQQIAERRRVEQLQRDAILYRQNRLLSVVFFHWQNYALAWKDAEAARKKDRRLPVQPKGPPSPPIRSIEPTNDDGVRVEDDEEEISLHFRRPLSPIKKRINAKTQARRQDSAGLAPPPSPPAPSLADAASLSLNVKKRLLVLGKWKPTHKSLSHV